MFIELSPCLNSTMQNPCENIAVTKLKEESQILEKKLSKLQLIEEWFQNEKAELKKKRGTEVVSTSSKEPIDSSIPVKLYNQLYELLSAVQITELQILELKERIKKERMKKEFTGLYQNLVTPTSTSNRLLDAWYADIVATKQNSKTNQDSSWYDTDELFYNVEYKQSVGSTVKELAFSTRHCGMCACIAVEADGLNSVKVKSDIHIDNLEMFVSSYIQDKGSISDLVTNEIWRCLKQCRSCNNAEQSITTASR